MIIKICNLDLICAKFTNPMLEIPLEHPYRIDNIPGGFLVQRSIRGRAAEMGLKISLLV